MKDTLHAIKYFTKRILHLFTYIVWALRVQGFIPTDHQVEWDFFSSRYISRLHFFFQCKTVQNSWKVRLNFLNGCASDSKGPSSGGISGQFQLFAGGCNSWFSYRDPAVGARVPSQPVVVVGEMTVWIVSHKPWCAGHLCCRSWGGRWGIRWSFWHFGRLSSQFLKNESETPRAAGPVSLPFS